MTRLSRRKKKHLRRITPPGLIDCRTSKDFWATSWNIWNLGNDVPLHDPSWPRRTKEET